MDYIKESLDKLIRGASDSLDAYLLEVCKNESIDSTKAEMHIYMLRLDGNNRPQIIISELKYRKLGGSEKTPQPYLYLAEGYA